MKKIHTFGILLLVMMLVGCVTAGVGFTNEQLSGIHRGMTLEQVKEVLGAPAYRSFELFLNHQADCLQAALLVFPQDAHGIRQ